MSPELQIAAVAVACSLACSLAGVFLVLRRLSMTADAISHSVLPGLVAGYILANGPNLLAGLLGAFVAGLLTVGIVHLLTEKAKVTTDSALGIVFPTMFALGVLTVTKFLPNAHVDADAVLYGEIAFAPFDALRFQGINLGPASFWSLTLVGLINATVLSLLFKELKISTFDGLLSQAFGFRPGALHFTLMALVAMTTVASFSAVGAILAVALIIIPPISARLLARSLSSHLAWTLVLACAGSLVGCWIALTIDVSVSGMIATSHGLLFVVLTLFAPQRGLISQWSVRRARSAEFELDMLLVHLQTHETSDRDSFERTMLHIERELSWSTSSTARLAQQAEKHGYILRKDGLLSLTAKARERLNRLELLT